MNLDQVAFVVTGARACVLTLPDGRRLRVHREWAQLLADDTPPGKACEWIAPGNDRSDD